MKAMHTSLVRSAAVALLGIGAVLSVASSAFAADSAEVLGPNIVTNGGFETGSDPGVSLTIPVGSPYLSNWTTFGTELRVVGSYWQPAEGARSLGMANYGKVVPDAKTIPDSASGVTQTLSTKPGQRYRVTFYQAGNPYDHQPAVVHMQLGNVTKDFTYQADAKATAKQMDWVQRSLVYTATSASTTLTFYAYYTPGNDPLGLDNVQVRAIKDTAAATATPAPAKATSVPAKATPPAGVTTGTTLQVGSATLSGQGQQTVHTAKNASVTLVIDYPDGTQITVPGHAGGLHGNVHVTVDSTGNVAQGSFIVA